MSGNKRVNRRRFVKQALTGGATAAVLPGILSCGGSGEESPRNAPAVQTGRRVMWRLASSFPRGLDTIYGTAEFFARRLEAISEGRFLVRPYPAGELVPGLQVMDAVQQGTVQVAHTASYYFTGKSPALAFDAGVPFGLTARQQFAWLYHGGGLELIRELFADFGIVVFPAGSTGAQMGGWFKREVNRASDLKGLRMRIPGLGGEVMSRLGVTVQVLAGGDIFPALERGVIDATEWVGPYDDEKLGFHKVARYYYYPGWWEPGPTLSFHVNLREWNSLPSEYREMFQTAAVEASTWMLGKYDSVNAPALQRLRDAGVQFRRFSDDIMQAAYEAAFSLYEEQSAKDSGYRKVYQAWLAWRRQMYRWFDTAERAYADFAFGRPTPGAA